MTQTVTAKKTQSKSPRKDTGIISYVLIHDFAGERVKSHNAIINEVSKTIDNIDRQIEEISSVNKQKEIIICLGLASDKIINHIYSKHINKNVRIIENQNFLETNSCESLRIILNNTSSKKIVIMMGDNKVYNKAISRAKENMCYAVVNKDKNNVENVGVNISPGNNIEHFSFGACHEWKNCLMLFDKSLINLLKKKLNNENYRKKLVFEVLNDLIDNKTKFQAIKIK